MHQGIYSVQGEFSQGRIRKALENTIVVRAWRRKQRRKWPRVQGGEGAFQPTRKQARTVSVCAGAVTFRVDGNTTSPSPICVLLPPPTSLILGTRLHLRYSGVLLLIYPSLPLECKLCRVRASVLFAAVATVLRTPPSTW